MVVGQQLYRQPFHLHPLDRSCRCVLSPFIGTVYVGLGEIEGCLAPKAFLGVPADGFLGGTPRGLVLGTPRGLVLGVPPEGFATVVLGY